MNPELLSRLQFAFTISFHFIYPPISMGLGLLIVVIGALYVRTKDPKWRELSFFWIKIYGLVFALGVALALGATLHLAAGWALAEAAVFATLFFAVAGRFGALVAVALRAPGFGLACVGDLRRGFAGFLAMVFLAIRGPTSDSWGRSRKLQIITSS